MKKRFTAISLALLLSLGALAGCGNTGAASPGEGSQNTVEPTNQSTDDSQADPEPAPETDVTLRYEWWGGNATHEAYTNLHATYTEMHPNVTMEPEYSSFDGYQEKLMTQLAGGTVADLFHIDAPWMNELTSRGDYFYNLNEQDVVDISGIDEAILEQFCVFNDELCAIPMGVQSLCMIVNQKSAKEYGLEITGQMTWDEIIAMAKELRAKDPDAYLIIGDSAHIGVAAYAMLRQLTGTQVFNDDYSIAFSKEDLLFTYNKLMECFEAGVYEPLGEADLYRGSTTPNPKWVNGKGVTRLCWNSEFAGFSTTVEEGTEEMDIVPYPTLGADAKQGSADIRPTYLVGINKDTQNLDAALAYLNWQLNDPEAAVILGSVRAVPSTSVQQEAAVEAGVLAEPVIRALNEGYENMSERANEPTKNSEVFDAFLDEMSKMIYGMVTPEEAVENTFTTVEEVLNRLKP